MKNQRFKLRNSNQYVYVLKGSSKYSDVLLPFDREARNGHRGTVMTVRNENLIEDNSGGYNG